MTMTCWQEVKILLLTNADRDMAAAEANAFAAANPGCAIFLVDNIPPGSDVIYPGYKAGPETIDQLAGTVPPQPPNTD